MQFRTKTTETYSDGEGVGSAVTGGGAVNDG